MPYATEENLTDLALERWNQISDPRLREIMQSFVKHLHGFVREIEPTPQEWFTAIDWLTRTGKISSEKRQEFILASDVLGISMLVDAINNRRASGATPNTVEGPFHIPGSPELADGEDVAKGAPGTPCFVVGHVRDLNGKPLGRANAGEMNFDFGQLIAHAAKTRPLVAGTILGSGTVSNKLDGGHGKPVDAGGAGYSCLAELRIVEKMEGGEAKTPFLRFGDTVRIEMKDRNGHSIFGAIEQTVEQ